MDVVLSATWTKPISYFSMAAFAIMVPIVGGLVFSGATGAGTLGTVLCGLCLLLALCLFLNTVCTVSTAYLRHGDQVLVVQKVFSSLAYELEANDTNFTWEAGTLHSKNGRSWKVIYIELELGEKEGDNDRHFVIYEGDIDTEAIFNEWAPQRAKDAVAKQDADCTDTKAKSLN